MKKFFKNSGFTLFELLAVLAILAIVAGIAVPRVMQTITNSRVSALEAEMQLVANSIQRMLMEYEIQWSNNKNKAINVPFYIAGGEVLDGADVVFEDLFDKYVDSTFSTTITTPATVDDSFVMETINSDLLIEDYLEGGVPEYLLVYVYDPYDTLYDGTKSGSANILVIYDEELNPDNMYGTVSMYDLNFEDPLGLGAGSGSIDTTDFEGGTLVRNYVYSEVEYTGTNEDFTS